MVDRGLDVAPLGQTEVVPAVRAGNDALVVAIVGHQGGPTQLVQGADRTQGLLAARSAAMDEDRPPVTTAGGRIGRGDDPRRQDAQLAKHRQVVGAQAQ